MLRFMTPLRWLIVLLYIIVAIFAGIYLEEIGTFWDFVIGNSVALIKAIGAVIGALLTAKFGIAITAIIAATVTIIKVVLLILFQAILPGTLKAIFLPVLFSVLSWIHDEVVVLQRFVAWLLGWSKGQYTGLREWWQNQSLVDRILLGSLLSFLIPIIGLVFFYKKFILPFIAKKIGENIIQRSAKFLWKVTRKVPLIGLLLRHIRVRFYLARKFVVQKNRAFKEIVASLRKGRVEK